MNRLLLPVSLDRYANPISSLLREIAVRTPHWDTSSISNPDQAVGEETVAALWELPHMHRCSLPGLMLKSYDLAHVASATGRNRLLLRLARWRSLGYMKTIYTANVEPFEEDDNLEYYRSLVLGADALVSVSECVRESVRKRWGRDSDAVIPNGADEKFFDPAMMATPETGARPYFLYVGGMVPRKRPDLVLEIAKRMPSVDFIFAGNFPFPEYAAACKQTAAGLANVQLLGAVDRLGLRQWLAGARAMVFPSEIEGLPLSVIEAQMKGLPVVGQPRTAMPELVAHGENGDLIEGTDLQAWEKTLQELLVRPDNVPQSPWRQSIRERAVRKCAWSEVARQYGELYQRVLGR